MTDPDIIEPDRALAVIEDAPHDMRMARAPEVVLQEAQKAAAALKRVIDAKPKKVVFNKKTYLEFEDWQTLGRFYGVTAKIVSTTYVEFGDVKGFEARAVAVRADGLEISAAEAMCLNDEERWSTRAKYEWHGRERIKVGEEAVPLFQLRSMAQTRAAAKALRTCLSWVAVLAGYAATPAEEMDGVIHAEAKPDAGDVPSKTLPPAPAGTAGTISEAQGKRLFAIAMSSGWDKAEFNEWLKVQLGVSRMREITAEDYPRVVELVQGYKAGETAL